MATVNILPLADWMRGKKYKPLPPPIFQGGEPTRGDVELGLALIEALDAESRVWYAGTVVRLRDRLAEGGAD